MSAWPELRSTDLRASSPADGLILHLRGKGRQSSVFFMSCLLPVTSWHLVGPPCSTYERAWVVKLMLIHYCTSSVHLVFSEERFGSLDFVLLLQDFIKLHLHQPAPLFFFFSLRSPSGYKEYPQHTFLFTFFFLFFSFSAIIITTGMFWMNKAAGTLLTLHCDDGAATTTRRWHNDRAASPRRASSPAAETSCFLCGVSLTRPVGTESRWCDAASPEGSRYWADELEQGRLNEQLCHPASIIKFIMRLGAVEAGERGEGARGRVSRVGK